MSLSATAAAVKAADRDGEAPGTTPVFDTSRRSRKPFGVRALRAAAVFWFGVTVLGQLVFAVYVAGVYGRAVVQGGQASWTKLLPHGYVAGDPLGNAVIFSHLLFAMIVMVGGALQLVPQLRRSRPSFHRWNGRVYLLLASLAGAGGMITMWTRGTVGSLAHHLATSLNGLLIVTFAAIAWRHARARRFDVHRRWALRLFLVVSGVWFFRVGSGFWMAVLGPVGFDPETYTGPFLTALGFAQYLLPLGVLELYFRAQDRRDPRGQLAIAVGLLLLAVVMVIGIARATAKMWLPRLTG